MSDPSTERQRVEELLDLRLAHLVVVYDRWSGMSPPSSTVFTLRRDDDGGLTGEAVCSKHDIRTHIERVSLTRAQTTKLLRYLLRAEAVLGPYAPQISWTDDFPSIEIAVHVNQPGASGIALLHSTSQGEFHSPWGALIGGEPYVLASDDVGRALNLLRALVTPVEHSIARHGDWKTLAFPKAHERIEYQRTFSQREWIRVRMGLCPVEQEDKWFVYADNEWLWLHRSWTGHCVFKARVRDVVDGGVIDEVWVNKNPKQYESGPEDAPLFSRVVESLLLRR
jgi:hypothetical protein